MGTLGRSLPKVLMVCFALIGVKPYIIPDTVYERAWMSSSDRSTDHNGLVRANSIADLMDVNRRDSISLFPSFFK